MYVHLLSAFSHLPSSPTHTKSQLPLPLNDASLRNSTVKGLAEAAGESSNDWVSSVILAAQKAANALALFASGAAFDRALHNDGGCELQYC